MRKSRLGISVMFMTFIAISILSTIFLTYYLYLTQQNLSASEAQRIYAEASQERLEAFFYPPMSESSELGLSQRLKIYNRGVGTMVKYIFAFGVRDTPLNGGDIVLRSGERIEIQLDELLPDDEVVRIVTERGSVFIAQLGYFNTSFDPALLVLYPGQNESSVLRTTSNNYESRLRITVTDADIGYEIIGETEFNLTRKGVHPVTFVLIAPDAAGTYHLRVRVEDLDIGYYKEAELEVRVESVVPTPYFEVIVDQKQVSGYPNQWRLLTLRVVGYNGYSGTVRLTVEEPDNILRNEIFTPNPVTLTPDNPEQTVWLVFRIAPNADPGTYRIWIVGSDGQRESRDYFDLTVF